MSKRALKHSSLLSPNIIMIVCAVSLMIFGPEKTSPKLRVLQFVVGYHLVVEHSVGNTFSLVSPALV